MTVSATANPAAVVALARDRRTTLVAPGLLVVVGLLVAALGVAFATVQGPGVTMVVLVVLGAALAGLGAWVILRIRSLRLRVEPDYLHLTGIGVDRRYHLAPGSMARVAASGVRRSRRPSGLGSAVGPATLGSGETVELIRLGATPSVILVPTQSGRVALAAAAEGELVQALMSAAQKRAERAPVAPAVAAAVVSAPPVPRPAEPEPPARPLTGIERMELEERLAQERRAAFTGARTEQAAASLASVAALSPPAPPAYVPPMAPPIAPPIVAPAPPPTVAPAPADPTPAVVAPLAGVPAAPPSATATPAATPVVIAPPRRLPRALPRRRPAMATRVGRPIPTMDIALAAAPLVGAGLVWFMAAATQAFPDVEGIDPIGAALLLCGPVALLAVVLARTRWPRLAGLTSVSAMIALALVVRALIG